MSLNTAFMVDIFFAALAGVPVTLGLTAVTLMISFPLGFFLALRKERGGRVTRRLIAFYISFVRGTPRKVFDQPKEERTIQFLRRVRYADYDYSI